jgi:hypothetical protein
VRTVGAVPSGRTALLIAGRFSFRKASP